MNSKPPAPLAVQVGFFTLIRLVLNTSYRMIYPYLSTFQAGLGVGLPAISIILSLRSLLSFAGPFLSPIADRRGRRVSMLLGMLIFTLGALAVVFFPTYAGFFASLLLMSLAFSIFLPAMQAYLGDRVAYARRGRVMGITELSWSFAFILGVPLVGWLLARSGAWQSPFPVLAALGGLGVIGLLVFIPQDAPRSNPDQAQSAPLPIGSLLKVGAVRAGLLTAVCLNTSNEMVNLVFGIWLEDAFQFKLAALGAASLAIGLSEMSGEGLSAALVDRLGKTWSVRAGILLNCLAAGALFLFGGNVFGALGGLFLFYLTCEFTLVSLLPLMSETLPALRATVMATTVASLALGRAIGTQFSPLIYEQFGMAGNTIVALAINGLALVALAHIRVAEDGSAGSQAS
ncbi:MAG: MFS transporter [Bellilinea sp.]|jgi:predicted MFS family arabinose efflux permease